MDWLANWLTEIINLGIGSIIIAIVVWVEKQYIATKDQTIAAKQAEITALERQIDFLKSFTAPELQPHFASMRAVYEELFVAEREQTAKAKQLATRLSEQGNTQGEEIARLTQEKEEAERQATILQNKLAGVEAALQQEQVPPVVGVGVKPEDISPIQAIQAAMQEDLGRRREIWRWYSFATSEEDWHKLAASAGEVSRWMQEFRNQSDQVLSIGSGGPGREPQAYLQFQRGPNHVSRLHFVVSAFEGRPVILARAFEGKPEQVRQEGFAWVDQHRLF